MFQNKEVLVLPIEHIPQKGRRKGLGQTTLQTAFRNYLLTLQSCVTTF